VHAHALQAYAEVGQIIIRLVFFTSIDRETHGPREGTAGRHARVPSSVPFVCVDISELYCQVWPPDT
jgi:hypothetical protein